ncbi:hypothetical protein F4821DRAFT_236189 [Hypoxylon rubiginosum]|uniref:Uncharacterized protein n=1 Tax=Hypoxylon rubiginosum TaxID=110542 RepID=A0ACC0D408_9PEZI|nr:hypothetical protein F4821DRAFT_236189 [Hypoxylon rubiginosum]
MDPFSTVASVAGLVAPIVQLIWSLSKIGLEIKDVPETSKVFMGILGQIGRDIQHSILCYDEIAPRLKKSSLQVEWAVQAIEAAIFELNQFREFVDNVGNTDFKHKVTFVLKEYKQLSDKERAIRFAHSRLLTAIGTMHAIALQLGLYVSPATARPSRRRMSPAPPRLSIEYTENTVHSVLDSFGVAGKETVFITATEVP